MGGLPSLSKGGKAKRQKGPFTDTDSDSDSDDGGGGGDVLSVRAGRKPRQASAGRAPGLSSLSCLDLPTIS